MIVVLRSEPCRVDMVDVLCSVGDIKRLKPSFIALCLAITVATNYVFVISLLQKIKHHVEFCVVFVSEIKH